MASVRKNPTVKGTLRWQAVWAERADGGRTQRRTKNFNTQKEAREHAQRMEVEVERRGIGDPQKHSLERYLKRWLATLTERGELSPTTLAAYRWQADIACRHIGHIPLEKLSPADIDQLYSILLRRGGITRRPSADGTKGTRPLTARTVLNVHRVISNALEQARRWKMIAENPAKDARAPTPRRQHVKSFKTDEVQRLLDAAADDRETHTIIATLLTTGMRRSELLGLAFDALDLDAGTLAVRRVVLEVGHEPVVRGMPKTKSSERTVSIPAILVELLRLQKAHVLETAMKWGRGYRREPMFLFARPDGEPLPPMSLTLRLRQVMRRAAISGRPPAHGWRHTAATVLVGSGTDIKTVQTRLGHSTPAITLALYVHPTIERDQAAGEHLASLIKRAPKA
jgi:integrase